MIFCVRTTSPFLASSARTGLSTSPISMGSIHEAAPALPQPRYTTIANGVSLLHPLSRRGHGPGLIVLIHEDDINKSHDPTIIHDGIPMPTFKWAEESFLIAEVRQQAWQDCKDPLAVALDAIFNCDACDQKQSVGLICESHARSTSNWPNALLN